MNINSFCRLQVSTLFEEEEEESSIFPLKGGSVNLSCPMDPPATQEELAQSAHLMSLGLCRISATKPPPPPPTASSCPLQHPSPPEDFSRPPQPDSLKQTNGRHTPPSSRRRLPCLLCPLMLTSRRLLDVHVRSHCASGGFSCVCCSWTADSWEELEPHWRSHSRRRRRVEHKQEEKKKVAAAARPFSCRRTFRNAASQNTHQQTHKLPGY